MKHSTFVAAAGEARVQVVARNKPGELIFMGKRSGTRSSVWKST